MKLIFPVLVLSFLTSPALGQDAMTRTSCQDSYKRIVDMISLDDPVIGLQIQSTRTSSDGWCQFRRTDPGFGDMPFDTIEWAFEDTTRWTRDGIPPLAIHLRIQGFVPQDAEPNTPDLDIKATVRQIPEAGQVILERAIMSNDQGDVLTVSGVFERLFLSSTSMMQVSLGSATFKAGLMSMTLTGEVENPFGFNAEVTVNGTSQSQGQAAFDAINRLPDTLIDDASRAELMAYAADLPKPVGTIELAASSERGLGLVQFGAAAYSGFVSIMDDREMSREMEIMFDGLSITANWTPAAQMAD